MSFTPRNLPCLGLPCWHSGLGELPALQWIPSVLQPALLHISVLRALPRERPDFWYLENKTKQKAINKPHQRTINQEWKESNLQGNMQL